MAEDGRSRRPRRIILVRHGESEGNVDSKKYCDIADPKIRLTEAGANQAKECGEKIRDMIKTQSEDDEWLVYFYVSPYTRTLCTLKEIGRAFESDKKHIVGVREEPRIREQDFGNFQETHKITAVKKERQRFGRFFYRFPEGESAADVFDRVTSFLESLWRDIDMNRLHKPSSTKTLEVNLVIVSHGVTMRVFLMRWFKWTVEQFEKLNNPKNCEVRVMELGEGEEYSLLVHHTQEELEEWGLDVDMIKDQEQRKHGKRGDMNGLEPGDEWPRSGFQFFENHEETSFLNRELEQCEAEQMATDEENYFLVDGSVRGG
ncbi:phosphoglycerate mutase-like protein AT74H [Physcomitrium patens]|uniref:Phosphoglycerate mutase-like protein n=1 Tax=Physcomitrium patens TaxID=3218 RepID=A0A2K1KZP0_PHYPA|nr:phosphoglycerate mutase-like protein AT74H isoform X2 [Physcomitrium patens]XP_024358727.1 phosphoglycerate mutase-like protein AT74H isoform X2 [Physcomitrium patens]PNR59255.1 hypothetical protein PHYPA_002046 [Physcomitrium patens]|eukprot:XP_024358718.1 phosphoglycerate mutase-like protein AT74H isoform X2 [Physcomitrella patens]